MTDTPCPAQGDARGRVSVVVVAYGSEPWLERCVASALESCDVDVEVVLVDNGCTDDAVDRVESRTGVRVIRPGTNLGFASGCNLGARHATGDVLVLLNQDAVVEPHALAALADVASRPDVGVATASVRLSSNPRLLNSSGNPVHFVGFAWSGGFEEPADRYDEERDVTAASGAGMAVRRPVWDRFGGFADEYFAYHEDVEFSLRCWQQGLRVVYVPSAVVTHRYQFSRNRRKYYLMERNRLVLVLTMTDWRTLALLLPALVATELGMLLVAGAGGWLPDKLAGWLWLVRNRRWVTARRRQLQSERAVADEVVNRRLVARFDAGTQLPLPAWCRPFDRALATYWALVLRLRSVQGRSLAAG